MVEAAAAVSKERGIQIGVAPPAHLLAPAVATAVTAGPVVGIFAQHVDPKKPGSTTGHVVPEAVRGIGAIGSMVNHSERRLDGATVEATLARLKLLGMISVACVRDAGEAGRYALMGPDYVAVEPPELIGSGRAVSAERPELIREAADAVAAAGRGMSEPPTFLCGAGIVSERDVRKSFDLGAMGVLVASGVVKADNWRSAIADLASGFD